MSNEYKFDTLFCKHESQMGCISLIYDFNLVTCNPIRKKGWQETIFKFKK